MSAPSSPIDSLVQLLALLSAAAPGDARVGRALIRLRRAATRQRETARLDAAARSRLQRLVEDIPAVAERLQLDATNRAGVSRACAAVLERLRAEGRSGEAAKRLFGATKRARSPDTGPASLSRPAKRRSEPSEAKTPAVTPTQNAALSDAALLRTLALHPSRLPQSSRSIADLVGAVIAKARDTSGLRDELAGLRWPTRRARLWRHCESLRPRGGRLAEAFDAVTSRMERDDAATDGAAEVLAMVEMLGRLCAPVRDEAVGEIRRLARASDIELAVDALLRLIGDMRGDMLQHSASVLTAGGTLSADDALRREAQMRERAAVTAIWGSRKALGEAAKLWAQQRTGTHDVLSALLDLIFGAIAAASLALPDAPSSPNQLPAMLALAQSEIVALQNHVQAVTLAAALHALAPARSTPWRLLTLLTGEAARSDPADGGGQLVADDLAAELGVETAAVRRILRGGDDPVYKLLAKRLRDHLHTVCRSTAAPPTFVMRTGVSSSAAPSTTSAPSDPSVAGFADDALGAAIGELSHELRDLWTWARETWLNE